LVLLVSTFNHNKKLLTIFHLKWAVYAYKQYRQIKIIFFRLKTVFLSNPHNRSKSKIKNKSF